MDQIVTCILNDKAGAQRDANAQTLIPRIAAEYGAQARVLVARDGADLTRLAMQACEVGGLIVAGGGDGTIGAVAAAVVNSKAAFGVLPMGTLNHFAKDLNIPLDLEAAVRTLFTGSVTRVDVGEVNGRVFLNNSSIGLYPQIVREREKQQRHGRGKWIAFAQATAYVLRRATTLHVELDHNRQDILLRDTHFLFVGNNRYEITGLEIGKRTALNCGTLWIAAAPNAGRLKLFGLAAAALLGRSSHADLSTLDTIETWVRTRRRHVDVAIDGEVHIMQSPLHYRIRPAALRVIAPMGT